MVDAVATRTGFKHGTLARIAIIYVVARFVTTGFLLLASALAPATSRFGENPKLLEFAAGWDAWWYGVVVHCGYPRSIPIGESGVAAENAWAFMPLYPLTSLAVGTPFEFFFPEQTLESCATPHASWVLGALLVSLISGFIATLLLYRLSVPRIGETAAMWAATFFAFGPLAALFHVGYAEAMFLALLLGGLVLVQERNYAWLYAVIPAMAFTRPGVLAFALFLALYCVWRWFRRAHDPFPAKQIALLVGAGLLAAALGFVWMIIAAAHTGTPDAYLETELSWRRAWMSDPTIEFVPFAGWFQAARMWMYQWFGTSTGAYLLVVAVMAASVLLLFSRNVKKLGVPIRLWSFSYLLYLFAVFFPQSSTFRLLLPLTPLAGALAVPKSTAYRWGVLVVCISLQWVWLYNMYAFGATTYWRTP